MTPELTGDEHINPYQTVVRARERVCADKTEEWIVLCWPENARIQDRQG